jgi:hypothetical protein
LHIRRLREILSFHLVNFANTPSPSLFSHYCPADEEEGEVMGAEQPAKANNKAAGNKNGAAKASNDAPKQAVATKGKRSEVPADLKSPMSLKSFYPSVSASEPQCVKSIEFAGWNPPPGNRALLGAHTRSTIIKSSQRADICLTYPHESLCCFPFSLSLARFLLLRRCR